MSHKDESNVGGKTLKGVTDTLQRAGAAAAVAGMTGTDPVDAAKKALLAGSFVAAMPILGAAWDNMIDKRRETWWLSATAEFTPAEIHDIVSHRLEKDPNIRSAILESLRTLTQALDDAVIPVIGALTAEYIRLGRAADSFLRGFSRALSDMSSADLGYFRQLVTGLVKTSGWGLVPIHCCYSSDAQPGVFSGDVCVLFQPDPAAEWYIDNPDAAVHLFRILTVNGIAHDAARGPHWMILDVATTFRLHLLLGGSEADVHLGPEKSSK